MIINKYKRYQRGLKIQDLFPKRNDSICACGCNKKLPPRKRRWASKECQKKSLIFFLVIKGDVQVIREKLKEIDNGFCRHCGIGDEKWEADHIIPVHKGGGGCDINNLQTLCDYCHKKKTKIDLYNK